MRESIAVVGFGYWGKKLIKALKSLKAKIGYICVVDTDKQKQKNAKQNKIDYFSDISKAYKYVDALIVATPDHTHYQITKQALQKGKHVLVEKPLALKYSQARTLVKIASNSNLTLMIDNTFVFDESFRIIKTKLDNGTIGDLIRIDSFRFSKNIIRDKTNVLIDLMPHDISIFHTVLKKSPSKIEVNEDKVINKNYDSAFVRCKYGSVVTHSHLSWIYPYNKREMIFFGSKGVIWWGKVQEHKDKITFYKYNEEKRLMKSKDREITNKRNTLKTVLTEFFSCIELNREPITSAKNILPQVAIFEKIIKSLNHKTH